MSEPNPYAPPRARVADVTSDSGELAGRWARLGAALLDGVITLLWGGPLSYAFGAFDGFPRMTPLPFARTALLALLNFAISLLVQGYFLQRNGQTIGKKVAGIRIAMLDGSIPPLWRIVVLRYLPVAAASLIPVIGSFLTVIDVLFVFRDDRRCVHDLIAGTQVVKA